LDRKNMAETAMLQNAKHPDEVFVRAP
jgi:hypothetical protein